MVDQNFLLFEANWIKAILLCWTDQCDRIIWPDSPDGNYSVKVGYQKFCEEADASNASSSDPTQQTSFWKKVWKLQVPNKIKNFLWRVCSNALPTKENLKKRKILDDARCNACQTEQESILHALWECEKLSHVWAPCFSWVRTEHPHIRDMQDLINLLGQLVQRLELFGVVAWFIWSHRNRLRLNEKGLPSEKIFEAAKTYLSNYQAKCPTSRMKQPKENTKWQPPVEGIYKTNYDGTVFTESGEAGIGVIVRDARGEVIAALAKKILYSGLVEVLEDLAARRAAKFAVELGLSSSILEGDSEVVYKALQASDWCHSSISEIVNDTVSMVGSLRTFSFSYTRQQGNNAAHALAKRVIVSFPLLVWMEHVPPDASPFVIFDLSFDE